MRLLAISDLHLGSPSNMEALAELPAFPADWLIVAGDLAEDVGRFQAGLSMLCARFARVIWTPGNHDLWTVPGPDGLGLRKYQALVALARALGVATPEDPYLIWPGLSSSYVIAPLFLLYDLSFRPPDVKLEDVVAWAEQMQCVCADEVMLDPAPYSSRPDWCHARCRITEARLSAHNGAPTVLINHYPLRQELVRIPRIPRFSPWCGTVATRDWHVRFNARIAVSGHLHVRATDWHAGTRFEEVSLGYPPQWDRTRGIANYLREILPGPDAG
jgi:3',5'-cyclic AMP phosphodiesterase CpdA